MSKSRFLIFGIFFVVGCITTEEGRNKLVAGSTEGIEMDLPDEPTVAIDSKDGVSDQIDVTTLVVIADDVKALEKPEKNSKVRNKLVKWQEVIVVTRKGNWMELKGLGWVQADQLGE